MTKVQFRVRDNANKVIAGATLTLRCKLNNGESWQSDVLQATNAGVAWLEIPDETFKLFNRQTVRIQVTKNDKVLKHAKPAFKQVNDATYQVIITVVDTSSPSSHDESETNHDDVPIPPSTPDDNPPEVNTAENKYRVYGTILHANGKPAAGFSVVAYDRDICDENVLGQVVSGDDGSYKITYTNTAFTDKTKPNADLIVRVFKTKNLKQMLAASPLFISAGDDQQVNLSVDKEQFKGRSLFEAVDRKISPLIAHKSWDCIEPQDIALMANRTGLQYATVAQFSTAKLFAEQLAKKHDGKVAENSTLLFALFRAGHAPNLASLFAKPDHLIAQVLETALRANEVPPLDISTFIENSREMRAKVVAEAVSEIPKSIFKLAKLTPSQIQTATQHFVAQKSKGEAWESLSKQQGFNAATVSTLKSITLGAKLIGNLALLEAAQQAVKSVNPRSLAKLTANQWAELIEKQDIQLPNTLPGNNINERIKIHAESIARSVESQYPTNVFAHEVVDNKQMAKGEVGRIFNEYDDFDLETGSLVEHVIKKEGVDRDELLPLVQIENLYRIAPAFQKYKTVQVLWDANLKSALSVTKLGKNQFRKQFSGQLGGNTQVDKVFALAQGQVAINLAKSAQANAQINAINTNVLPSVYSIVENNAQLKSSYEQFYGPLSLINCEHCQSNLSPAAYLVDLLGFLEKASNGAGVSGRTLLAQRRPAIEKIEVSCINTDTLMPYIDLVLEVLENAVSPQANFAPQTTKNAEELAATPEHINLAAYEKLAVESYPWNLPFDLETEHSRAFLAQAGVPRHQLLRLLRQYDDKRTLFESSIEYLGLTVKQATLITAPLFGTPAKNLALAKLWGFTKFADLIGANQIESVMARMNLTLTELKAIFNSAFVNPTHVECFNVNGTVQNLNAEMLDRAHRMARLYHLTDYSIESLDMMLSVASEGETLIPELAAISFLEKEASISLEDINEAWALSESERAARFATLFGVPDEDAAKLNEITLLPWNTPITAMVIWEQLELLKESDLSLAEVYDLLMPPYAESAFAKDKVENALVLVFDALALLAQEETLSYGPDSISTVNSEQLESLVSITLVNGTTIEVSENQAKQNAVIVETLSSALSLESSLINDLLYLAPNELGLNFEQISSATDANALINSVTLFAKQVNLLTKIGLDARHYSDLIAIGHNTNLLALDELPTRNADKKPISTIALLATLAKVEIDWGLREQLLIGKLINDEPRYTELGEIISESSDWSVDDVEFMLSNSGFNWGSLENYIIHHGWRDMAKAMSLAKTLNVDVKTMWSYKEKSAYLEIKETLKAKYSESEWLDVCAQLTDRLREKQRDALLGWLIHHGTGPLADLYTDLDVYNYFLLDPEMSACFDTSRIVQATGSVQQFIQRILLSLEGDLAFGDNDQKAWEWRKNYRVWEANRKVFLYPENWIEPELRHNKTELFEALESQILQGSLTSENAEAALIDYAKGLHNIANLEMCGFCEHTDSDTKVNTLFLFARTRGIPHQYYLAKRISEVWTAWESVNVDIQGNHLMPVFYNNRLYLYWLILEEARDEEGYALGKEENAERIEEYKGKVAYWEGVLSSEKEELADALQGVEEFPNSQHMLDEVRESERKIKDQEKIICGYRYKLAEEQKFACYLKIQLAWSVLEDQKWVPTTLSEVKLNNQPSYIFGANPSAITVTTDIVSSELQIRVEYFKEYTNIKNPNDSYQGFLNPVNKNLKFGTYYIGSCGDNISLVSSLNAFYFTSRYLGKVKISDANQSFLKWQLSTNHLKLIETTLMLSPLGGLDEEEVLILQKIQGQRGSVLFSSDNDGSSKGSPFIFEDAKTSYLVTKEYDAPGTPIVNIPPPIEMPTPPEDPPVHIPHPIPIFPPVIRDPWGDFEDIIIDTDRWSFDDLTSSGPIFSGDLSQGRVVLNDTAFNAPLSKRLTTQSTLRSVDKKTVSYEKASFTLSEGGYSLADLNFGKLTPNSQEFLFRPLYHPYTCLYIRQLYKLGADGFYQPDVDSNKSDDEDLYQQKTPNSAYDFDNLYDPTDSVINDYPVEKIDFSLLSPYGLFNNEMFFYAPMLIATRLMQNQKFEEARKWFHYIFDPTSTEGQGGARIWRYSIFANTYNGLMSGNINQFFGDPEKFTAQYQQWIEHPFSPHAIAQTRVVAYMRYVIMRYLDNLLAWGDYLYRQDTRESINEATQLFVLAAQMLGPKPVVIDGIDTGSKLTVKKLVDGESNNIQFTFDAGSVESMVADDEAIGFLNTLLSFCVPQNDKFLGYWDTVSDRLFKIRHCMNIDGMLRSLALFQPPIDPALLVRAAAAGVSISSVVAGLSTVGRPVYRFNYMLARAHDFLGEVKQLGATLLSTLEKQDAEELAAIRSMNELELLKLMQDQKELTVDEASENLSSEKKSLARLAVTKTYYEGLLENPVLEAEKNQDRLDGVATALTFSASLASGVGAFVANVPDTSVGIAAAVKYGGSNLSNVSNAVSAGFRAGADIASYGSRLAGIFAARHRREQEWQFQLDAVEKDIEQTDQRIIAAEVRVALAKQDLSTFKTQIAQTKQADDFLRSKFTNIQLYAWLKNELSTLYFQAYQLAYDMAKKAEIAYRHEFGDTSTSFVGFGHWDSLHKGLLAGERLSLDLRRMEQSFIEKNKRDLELTKHISIAMLNPSQFMKLQNTGECEIDLPEFIFDLDYPGQYNRRIKSVSLSIPSITGPYTNVNCSLSLMSSSIRRDVNVRGADGLEQLATIAGQTIATSSAQNDAGVFQLDFRDERYLPFEGEGVISRWKLRLTPPELAQFDYESISDVILHMSYTAKYAENAVSTVTNEIVAGAEQVSEIIGSLPLLLDLERAFPDAWNLLKSNSQSDDATIAIQLEKKHFPFFARNRLGAVKAVDVYIDAPQTVEDETFESKTIALSPITEVTPRLMLESRVLKASFSESDISYSLEDWNNVAVWQLSIPTDMVSEIKSIGILINYTI